MTGQQLKLRIIGNVQGVFMRVNLKQIATALNLTGYVKNEPDGSVTVVAQGSQSQLEQLVAACSALSADPAKFSGLHASARVDDISQVWSEPSHHYTTFDIKYS